MSLVRIEPQLPEHLIESDTSLRDVSRWLRRLFFVFAALSSATAGVAAIVKIRQTVDAPGITEPIGLFDVRATQAGLIEDVLVETGDTISVGQNLVLIDSRQHQHESDQLDRQIAIRQTEQSKQEKTTPIAIAQRLQTVATAQAQLIRAEAAFRSRLVDLGLIADWDSLRLGYVHGTSIALDLAWADLQTARANVSSAESSLRLTKLDSLDIARRGIELQSMKTDLAFRRARATGFLVHATKAGVVLTDDVGRLRGRQVQAGELLFEIGTRNRWRAVVWIAARDIQSVQVGQKTLLQFPGLPQFDGHLTEGVVESIAPQASQASETRSMFRVIIAHGDAELDKHESVAVRRGYEVRARILTGNATPLEILTSSLRARAAGLKS
ncbi:MAG: HlyD family efflux transporter periplasmic adaptor subunit [Gemmatimonadaceae bacterium]|nr:HlyD family efflux transporter periplasmic adaptor subunit [Gemmatimonadaceae bacterium]